VCVCVCVRERERVISRKVKSHIRWLDYEGVVGILSFTLVAYYMRQGYVSDSRELQL